MKTAILISGRPRFTREFDDFLNSLTNYDQLDWYFLLWNSTHEQDVRIPPNMPHELEAIREYISSRLPANSNIAYLNSADQPAFVDDGQFKLTPWSIAQNIWTMYYGIKLVNDVREQNGPYDLVIRTRPDIGITEKLDLRAIHAHLSTQPPTVLMPDNHRHSMIGTPVNDLFAIGLPDIMSTYSRAFDSIPSMNQRNLPFHGETVLSYHLRENNIAVPLPNFHSVMRYYTHNGQPWVDDSSTDFGRWN